MSVEQRVFLLSSFPWIRCRCTTCCLLKLPTDRSTVRQMVRFSAICGRRLSALRNCWLSIFASFLRFFAAQNMYCIAPDRLRAFPKMLTRKSYSMAEPKITSCWPLALAAVVVPNVACSTTRSGCCFLFSRLCASVNAVTWKTKQRPRICWKRKRKCATKFIKYTILPHIHANREWERERPAQWNTEAISANNMRQKWQPTKSNIDPS